MKYILVSVGTRGDMEPFLALAQILQKQGHKTICAFPEQFKPLADDAGQRFFPLNKDVDGEDAVNLMGGKISLFKKIGILIRLYKLGVIVNKQMVNEQIQLFEQEKPDRVIFNGKSTYPIIWEMQNPGKAFLVSPIPCLIHKVNEYPHVGFKGNYGKTINRLTYSLTNFGLLKNISDTTKEVRAKLNIKSSKIKETLYGLNTLYAISPTLFRQPDYWPEQARVVGYFERNKQTNWNPEKELLDFIDSHPKMLFITFGSMTNPEPEKKTQLIIDILQRNKIPAIINIASGGLLEPEDYDRSLIRFEKTIPYDWIFPKIHAVIHHGGSGTTHAAVKNGCATMIIPHIIDQFHWNNLLSDLGVGPKGIAIDKLSEKKLEQKILDLFINEGYKLNAEQLALSMKSEDLESALLELLTK